MNPDPTVDRDSAAASGPNGAAERRWQAVFNQAFAGMAIADMSGRLVEANEAYERLTGYTHEELTAKTYVDLTHPEDRQMNSEQVQKIIDRECASVTFRKRYIRKNGELVWAQANLSLLRDDSGNAINLLNVVHDITELIRAEQKQQESDEAVRRSEARLRQIMEASTTGIIVNDLSGKFLYANPPVLRMLGYEVSDLTSGLLTWDLIQDPALRPTDDLALEELRATGTCQPYETEFVRRDGSRVPVYVGAAFVPDSPGFELLGTAFVTDLTALKEAQRELIQLNHELDSRVQERTAALQRAHDEMAGFTYHVSHDLRAPLRAIVGTARILQQDYAPTLPEEAAILLERQAVAANKLGTLIDELLKLSRLNREESRCETLDLTSLVREVAEELAAENELVLVQVEEGLIAEGDPRLVRLLITNLISNALRYSPNGGDVTVGIEDTETGRAFYVRDQGIGFDMAYADKLFRPFERLVTDAQFPGTGVGLANVARIIEKHEGRVWADSAPGQGATFYFTLR